MISEKYRIDADERNYIVVQIGKTKAGKVTEKQVAFFTTIQNALLHIYRLETKKWIHTHDADLQHATDEFNKIRKEILEYGSSLIKYRCL